jgi:phosphoribosylformylglycinamidine synthase
MTPHKARACILRVGGTNCDAETKRACHKSGIEAEIVHSRELAKSQALLSYDFLIIPGGFSYGDYVRAGAIWAKELRAKLGKDLEKFVEDERPILGICNGFQVLIEAGLLPQIEGISVYPQAALGTNMPPGYNCRWIHLSHVGKGNCVFTKNVDANSVLKIPVAHSEGRFMFARRNEDKYIKKLLDEDQLVFRYCRRDGQYADGEYPFNPNGSFFDIAGICNSYGTVFGLMPHPERAYHRRQLPDWTETGLEPSYGDGKLIFDSVADYLEKRF